MLVLCELNQVKDRKMFLPSVKSFNEKKNWVKSDSKRVHDISFVREPQLEAKQRSRVRIFF